MERKIIECVPNFSEGRDRGVIDAIVAEMASVSNVKVLDVDPGEATNRTVVTIAGEPSAVVEAAFRGIRRAAMLIDMSRHHGAHPRMGATDVCPLVPVSGVTLEECAELARGLARRVADELHIPAYCYEASAMRPGRKNLAVCRAGEYEGLAGRLGHDDGADYGDRAWDDDIARTGATAIGARDFLIAVNFNLNTTSTRRANAIAFDVREKGRPLREGGRLTGKPLRDAEGKTLMQPGTLPGTKAIGWYIDEYGIAQVSMNITDTKTTPLHVAFDEVSRAAAARGLRVTGAEIVGLVPRSALVDAGCHYLHRQQRSAGIPESDIIDIAVRSMGLGELAPFKPREKVVEYILEDAEPRPPRLMDKTLQSFADSTASEAPAPGGGSVAAYMGALAAALGTMVANLSAHKAGWDDRWEEFAEQAVTGRRLLERLTALVDEDTAAFNRIMAAIGMPRGSDEERRARDEALETATLNAAEVPLRTMETAMETFDLLESMARTGNPASASDAGVGAIAAEAAVAGAALNVCINAASLADRRQADELCRRAHTLTATAAERRAAITDTVYNVISSLNS